MAETIKTILTADSSNFRNEFRRAQSEITSFRDNARASFAAFAGVIGGSQIISAFNNLRDQLGKLEDGALRLQMPVEEFQRLQAVAQITGSSVETLSKSLQKSYLNAVSARDGNEDLAKAFAILNINAAEFLNMGHTERMVALSRGLNGAADQAGATAAIFKVMGKSVVELLPALREGESGIEAISKRLQVLGSEDVAAVNKMSDEIDLLASNLKTNLTGAVISLRPQLEGFVGLLAKAAQGLAVFLDPAGGKGSQGGQLGGVEMLREMDRLQPKIQSIKAELQGKSWWEGTGDLTLALKNATAAIEVLKVRYAALTAEAKLYAEQLRDFERAKESGLTGDALAAEQQAIERRTKAGLDALAAERQRTIEAQATAEAMEKQASAAEKIADKLAGAKERVGSRIIGAQTPEIRADVYQKQLAELLAQEKAGSLNELKGRVNTGTPEEQLQAVTALEKAINLLEAIKKAKDEIAAKDADKFTKWAEQMEKEKEARDRMNEAAAELMKDRAEAQAGFEKAREEMRGRLEILQLQRDGQSAMAEELKKEIELRREAAEEAKRMNVTKDEALAMLKAERALEKSIADARGGLSARKDRRAEERDRLRVQRQEDARQRNAAAGGVARAGRGLDALELRRREAERRGAGVNPMEKKLDSFLGRSDDFFKTMETFVSKITAF